MDGNIVMGFAKVIGISLVPVALFGAGLHARYLIDKGQTIGRRVHLLPTPLPPPAGPPLEKLAADLRRLRPEVRTPRPGIAMARQRGIVAAYDNVLVSTAKALEIDTTMAELVDGIDREAERLRLEHALEVAGLTWQVKRT
ncbi:MAG: Conserved putative rane protein [Marmoricola sp.]|jgi:hypothetical protein|nr:Conserved putative rane protein [Marmoricola sp.]